MSPFISSSLASHTSAYCIACPAMPSLCSPLAPKGQLMKHTTAILLVLSIVLFGAVSSEARRLGVYGRNHGSSKSHLQGKDVATTSLKTDPQWRRQAEARSTVHTTAVDDHMAQVDMKAEEGVTMASSTTAGTVGATPVVRVSQRLFQREDTGFHLDYAGPRTHTPAHN